MNHHGALGLELDVCRFRHDQQVDDTRMGVGQFPVLAF